MYIDILSIYLKLNNNKLSYFTLCIYEINFVAVYPCDSNKLTLDLKVSTVHFNDVFIFNSYLTCNYSFI